MLTPRDLLKVEFKTTFRGYNEAQVDKFVKTVVAKYEEVYQENQRLKEELELERAKGDDVARDRQRIDDMIELARKTVEDAQETARREADAILHEARAMAALEREELRRELEEQRDRIRALQREEEAIRRRIEGLLRSMLQQLDELEAGRDREADTASRVRDHDEEADDVLAGWAADAAAASEDADRDDPGAPGDGFTASGSFERTTTRSI